jgi:hypothetical protein
MGLVLLLPTGGCGGTTNSYAPADPGTPVGSDQVTVTASSTGTVTTQHTLTLTVTIAK